MGNIEPQDGFGETSSRAEGIAFTQIPDHELIRQIGGGSYGEVWLARSALGTYRAVKIVYRKHFSHDRPFEREFSGIQKYEPVSRAQPGLMDILQAGRNDQAGYFYYVMELADDVSSGQQIDPANYTPHTLSRERSKRGRLPFEECLNIGLTLTSALGHLHKNGLVHRDIKPSNIIFVNGAPELADIGLVTDIEEAKSYVGTEGFIPQEGPGTPQADLYSLGKVLYEISTGLDRFDYPKLPTNLGEPNQHELVELNEIIIKACRTDPRERYQTADQMHADLWLLHRGRSLKQVHKLQRRLALATRVGIAALAAALLATGAWVGSIKQIRRARAAERKAEEVARFLNEMFVGVGPSVAKGRDTTLLKEVLEKASARVQKELKNQPEVQAELLCTLGESYTAVGLFEKGEELHRLALALGLKVLNPDDPKLAQLKRKLATNLWLAGIKHDEAERLLREAITQAINLCGRESLEVASLQKELTGVLVSSRKLPQAEVVANDSVATFRKLVNEKEKHRPGSDVAQSLAGSLNELATIYFRQYRLAESIAAQREALEIQKAVLGPEHLDVTTSLGNIACCLALQGEFAEAIRMGTESLALASRLLDPDHPFTAGGKVNLAKMHLAAGNLDQADDLLQEALACQRKQLPTNDVVFAVTLDGLGQIRMAQGRLDEAESLLYRALNIRTNWFGTDNYSVTITLYNLGQVLHRERRLADAQATLQVALTIQRKLLVPEDLDIAATAENLGLVLLEQGENAEAEALARKCLDVREKRWPDNWRTFSCQSLLGACLLQRTNYTEAEPLLESAYYSLAARANTIPFNSKCRLRAALQDLLRVYEATDQRDNFAVLTAKLEQLEK